MHKSLKFALGTVAALAVAGGGAMLAQADCFDDIKLCGMRAVGSLTFVHHRQDTYPDFYVTKIEVLNRNHVHPRQRAELAKTFPEETLSLVTAVQENKKGQFRQRVFIATEAQTQELEQELKTARNVKAAFKTVGQYLQPAYPIYPTVKGASYRHGDPEQRERIDAAIRAGKIDQTYIRNFFDRTTGPK